MDRLRTVTAAVIAVAVTLTACTPTGTPDPTAPLVTTGPILVPGTGEGTGALDARTPGGAR